MKPASEYLFIRSGRIPSDENSTTLEAVPTTVSGLAAPAPCVPTSKTTTAASPAASVAGKNARFIGFSSPTPVVARKAAAQRYTASRRFQRFGDVRAGLTPRGHRLFTRRA